MSKASGWPTLCAFGFCKGWVRSTLFPFKPFSTDSNYLNYKYSLTCHLFLIVFAVFGSPQLDHVRPITSRGLSLSSSFFRRTTNRQRLTPFLSTSSAHFAQTKPSENAASLLFSASCAHLQKQWRGSFPTIEVYPVLLPSEASAKEGFVRLASALKFSEPRPSQWVYKKCTRLPGPLQEVLNASIQAFRALCIRAGSWNYHGGTICETSFRPAPRSPANKPQAVPERSTESECPHGFGWAATDS